MIQTRFEHSLSQYAAALQALEHAQTAPSTEQILEVLSARDAVCRVCSTRSAEAFSGDCLALLDALDTRLKKQGVLIADAVKLENYRKSLNVPPDAWWWNFKTKETRWERFSWVFSALAVLLFTISLSLLSDILSRFLSGGPDVRGIFMMIVQTALTFIFTGGVITKTGREGFDRILKSFAVPDKYWPWIRIGSAVLVFGLLILFRLALPRIAAVYNNSGVRHFSAGAYTSAQYDFNRAIKLHPEYLEAHYNLGNLHESLGDIPSAQAEYKIAVRGGLDAAYNNLARLYIVEKKYEMAVPLLLSGLDIAQDEEIRYDLYKNLGWVRSGQNRWEDAEAQLRAAIAIKEGAAPAHCLLAQVLDQMERANESLVEWETCLKTADARRPDEDAWIRMAQTKLGGSKP